MVDRLIYVCFKYIIFKYMNFNFQSDVDRFQKCAYTLWRADLLKCKKLISHFRNPCVKTGSSLFLTELLLSYPILLNTL